MLQSGGWVSFAQGYGDHGITAPNKRETWRPLGPPYMALGLGIVSYQLHDFKMKVMWGGVWPRRGGRGAATGGEIKMKMKIKMKRGEGLLAVGGRMKF